jgi:RIO kinase 1
VPFANTGEPSTAGHRPTSQHVERRYKPPKQTWDDDVPEPDRTTYGEADHGPDPVPGWVVTDDDAWDEELGLLKTGKEADVFLVRRTTGDGARSNVLAAKRYRTSDHTTFRGGREYSAGRLTGDSRTDRAVARKTNKGMRMRASLWAAHEFDVLGRLWSEGAAVPYPVQLLDTELLLELVGDPVTAEAAPRLAMAKVDRALATALWPDVVGLLRAFVRAGLAHADLSPYNVLLHDGRLYAIDVPQAVDLLADPNGLTLLHRDCVNLCGWFARKGVEAADAEAVYAELLADVF